MPKSALAEYPAGLRPYAFHQVELAYKGGTEAQGVCPFCGSSKFFISAENGLFDCKVGGERGNPITFLRELHKYSVASDGDLELVSEERGIPVAVLKKWGLTKSLITGEWILPAYGPKNEINNLYVWRKLGGKLRLAATAGFDHCLFGTQFWSDNKVNVVVAEGPWDAMMLDAVLSEVKRQGDQYLVAQSPDESMAAAYNIVAVPGCESFKEPWYQRFAGKSVTFVYDNDYPRIQKNTGKTLPPAGYTGMKNAIKKLRSCSTPPVITNILHWGVDGYDGNRPDGYDLRDYFLDSVNGNDTVEQVTGLLNMIGPPPSDWFEGEAIVVNQEEPKLEPLPCTSYAELVDAWKEAMAWTDAMDITLSSMIATAVSTINLQDQVWLRIIGAGGTSKTTFCKALNVFSDTFMTSRFNGLHSGFTGGGVKDAGLIPLINGKTFIINEGDTLLKNPNREKIMSELRDLHCGTASNIFLNGVRNTYEGIRTTVILAGTATLRELNGSALGDRFLDCIIHTPKSKADERKLVRSVLFKKAKSCLTPSNGDLKSQDTPEMIRAFRMTGGFLEYLKPYVAAQEKWLEDHLTIEYLNTCELLGDFVASMRAWPHDDDAPVEKEVHFRLSMQLIKLGIHLAVVLGRRLDGEVLRRVAKVAEDTAYGCNYDICKLLYQMPLDAASIHARLPASYSRDKVTKSLRTLRDVKCVYADAPSHDAAVRRNVFLFKLTDDMRLLMSNVKKLLAHSEDAHAGHA